MNIGFNGLYTGLCNNGGSRTIIKCNQTLNKIGHSSFIISTHDKFDWFPHDPILKSIPKFLDVLIATGYHSIDSTLRSRVKKFWYVRGHEVWVAPEERLISLYKNKNMYKICNSHGLRKRLEGYGVQDVTTVHAGLDIEDWKDLNLRKEDKIRIGCLCNGLPTKNWNKFRQLAKALGNEKYEFVAFGIPKCNEDFLSEYLRSPSHEQLNEFYSKCHIWFAPTENEGFHNPPTEAGLCGCLLICSNNDNNGMIHDYAFNRKTAMVYDNLEEAIDMVKNPNWELASNLKKYLIEEIGDRKKNMKKMVEVLSK